MRIGIATFTTLTISSEATMETGLRPPPKEPKVLDSTRLERQVVGGVFGEPSSQNNAYPIVRQMYPNPAAPYYDGDYENYVLKLKNEKDFWHQHIKPHFGEVISDIIARPSHTMRFGDGATRSSPLPDNRSYSACTRLRVQTQDSHHDKNG